MVAMALLVNGAGWSNPAGFATGFAGVGVGVGICQPQKNPYPQHGLWGFVWTFLFAFFARLECTLLFSKLFSGS